jgi:hypothetical protein
MFILFLNLNTDFQSFSEIRALPSTARMRARVLREVDPILGDRWRHTHTCDMYICQWIDGRFYANRVVEGIWESRLPRAYLKVLLKLKMPIDLQADERRLAVAMAFHSRLGDGSMLGNLDPLLFNHIVWLAGFYLV